MITAIHLPPPTAGLTGGCWPTPEQILLLRAAILDAPAALTAWDEWKHRTDFDKVDAGSFRLLGLLYRNLLRLGAGPSDPLLPRLKGIYRHFWTRNQLVLGRKGELLRALKDRGIPCLLLKGAALTLLVYRDFGVRPMDDFDIMVPRDHVHAAMDILENLGWNSEVHQPRDLPLSIHACSFRDAQNSRVDLHWRLCHLPATAEFDRTLWQHALPVTLQDVATAAPSLTDQFLHTCAHGPQFKDISPVRWLPDAFFLLRQAGDTLDWHRIAANAPSVGGVQGVRGTLAFLRDHLEASVPPEALRLMGKVRVPLQERWENFFLSRPTPTPWHRMPLDLSHHLRCTRGQEWHQRLRGFRVYFRHANNLTPGQFSTHCRLWLRYHLRFLRRIFSREAPGSLRSLPPETFQHFHAIEPHRHRIFRWSHPGARLRLQVPRGVDCKIALDTGSLRSWKTDLSRHLRFTFEGSPIPVETVKSKQGILTFPIPQVSPDSAAPFQTLAWTCEPMHARNDPRELGLAVFAVRVLPQKKKRNRKDPVPKIENLRST